MGSRPAPYVFFRNDFDSSTVLFDAPREVTPAAADAGAGDAGQGQVHPGVGPRLEGYRETPAAAAGALQAGAAAVTAQAGRGR